MATIYTIEGNTRSGSAVIANGGEVCKKSYSSSNTAIAKIWRPTYNDGEAAKICQEAAKWVGYLEKKSNSQLDSFTANAGSNNYNIFAKHAAQATGATNIYVNGQAWCDMFLDDMFIRALGATRAKQLLYNWSAYTPTSSNYLKSAGATEITDFSKATYGDIIFFKNSTRIHHVGIVVTNAPAATTNTPNTSASGYYPKYTGTGSSITAALSAVGERDTSLTNRKKIAIANGIANYAGTAAQNTQMLNLLKAGTLKKATGSTSSSTVSTPKPATPVNYYPKYTGSSTSITSALRTVGEADASFRHRKKIAAANNIANYSGSASQNTQMLNLLKAGKLKKV